MSALGHVNSEEANAEYSRWLAVRPSPLELMPALDRPVLAEGATHIAAALKIVMRLNRCDVDVAAETIRGQAAARRTTFAQVAADIVDLDAAVSTCRVAPMAATLLSPGSTHRSKQPPTDVDAAIKIVMVENACGAASAARLILLRAEDNGITFTSVATEIVRIHAAYTATDRSDE